MGVAVGARGGWTPGPLALLGDERLARLAAAGHERAFTVVYERYHQALYRYCRSILRHDADAQDALQSTFASAYTALARGERDAPIRPWLYRIAHNEAISALRRRRPTTDLTEASDASTRSVEDQVAERAEISLLVRDLRQLTARQRSALVMRELSGLSHEDIAIALGTSVGGAKQTIYEARRTLFEFAEGRAMHCDELRRTVSDADGRALRSRRVQAHLRACSGCATFAESITTRTARLDALAPALPGVAAAGLIERLLGAGSGHGGAAASLAGASLGKAATAGMAANTLAGVAVVASATLGVTIGMNRLLHEAARGTMRPVAAASATVRSHGARSSQVGQVSSRYPALPGAAGNPARTPHAGASRAARVYARAGASGHSSSGVQQGMASTARGRPGSGAGSAGHVATATARAGGGPPARAASGNPAAAGSGKPAWARSGGSAPGGSGAASGHSAAAPTHSAAAPGHSAAAPGYAGTASGHANGAGSRSSGATSTGQPATTRPQPGAASGKSNAATGAAVSTITAATPKAAAPGLPAVLRGSPTLRRTILTKP